MTLEWIEWLAHTNFSFLCGASHPGEMLSTAQNLGYQGIAVCDFDGVYGLARAFRNWRELPETRRPRLFYGAEIHLSQDHELPIPQQNTLALIARSRHGYANLCKILSHAHRDSKNQAHIPLADLATLPLDDLSALIPMRGLLRLDATAWARQCETIKNTFGAEHTYMVLSRHKSPSEDIWLKKTLSVAASLSLKPLLSLDPFMHEKRRKRLSDMLAAIRVNLPLDECVEHTFVNDERYLAPPDEIQRLFADLPCFDEAITNSKNLAASCDFTFAELRYRYPKEMIPPGHSAQSFLSALTWSAARDTYGPAMPPKLKNLLDHELRLIETLGFADYFLTVWDIVSWARKQRILCQGRGSAANSAVCFVLGITAVDPEKFDLLFERFMSVERGDPPDIDVDFEHERREEVIQYIYQRYGREKSAMVANVITFRRKGSLRACGKALGISEDLLTMASDMIRSRVNAGKSTEDIIELLKEQTPRQQVPWNHWLTMATELKGFPRHLGIHSGGFMIADRPLHQLVPVEPATMPGRTVIQWCKDDIEELGFFKIDILALGMLTAIRKTLDMIQQSYQTTLTLSQIPQEDRSTYEMIQKADTVGTFQIESRAQMSMLPRLRPRTFYDLVIEVAIIRPGPIQGGMIHPFLRRRHGLEPVTFPDERLRPILHRTLGIPIFQEQVMRIAMAVGGFSPGEANELRKNMGAWSFKGDLNPWIEKLADGMRANGIAPPFAEMILSQMRGFADYGFPKSHSVSFALIAYASSYLKCHYPAAFFAGLLNSQPMGFYSPHSLIQAARRHGVAILPVCVQKSGFECALEPLNTGGIKEYAIRLGLRMVTGLSASSARQIPQARSRVSTWNSWNDFLSHTIIPRHDLTALAAANAFASFGLSRRSAVWIAAAAPHAAWLEDVDLHSRFPEEDASLSIQQDFVSTGTSLYAHPAGFIRGQSWCYEVPVAKIKTSQDLSELIPNQIVTVFGMILIQQRPPSAKGMMFITLEDEFGFINVALTPDAVERIGHKIHQQSFLCLTGKLQRDGSSHSVLAKDIHLPRLSKADVIPLPLHKPDHYHPPAKAAMMNQYGNKT